MKAPTCIICQTEFTPVRFLQRVCSIPCSKVWAKQKESEAKERNESKRPVKVAKPVREPAEYVKNREALKQQIRDEYGDLRCEQCMALIGGRQSHCHHLVYRSEKPNHEFLHDKRNLVIVCPECHEWYHESKGNRDQIVAERKLNLIFGDDVLNKSKS